MHRRGLGMAVASGLCALAWASAPARAEVRFLPRVGVDATWTDNIGLARPGQERQDEVIGRVTPGFRLTSTSAPLTLFLDYELQALYFSNTSGNDQVFHTGALGAEWMAIPNWLTFEVGGARDQVVVDPTQPSNVDNMFSVGNLADSTDAHATATVRHLFRSALLVADYTRGFVKYDAVDDTNPALVAGDDSKNDAAHLSLSSADANAVFTWAGRVRHEEVSYEDQRLVFEDQVFKYDRADVELGYGVTHALRLIAIGGAESDDSLTEAESDGGFDSTLWQAGFDWRPSVRDELRLLVGHRFFGKSYEALWRRTSRMATIDVSYTEEPTTQTQQRVLRPTPGPDGIIVPDPTFSRLTADAYLSKRLAGSIGLHGRITEVTLFLESDKREYMLLGGVEDKTQGASLVVTRQLGPRVAMDLEGMIHSYDLREGASYDEKRYAVRFSRLVGQQAAITFSANRVERSGSDEYSANWVMLGFTWGMGPNGAAGGLGGAGGRGGRDGVRGTGQQQRPASR